MTNFNPVVIAVCAVLCACGIGTSNPNNTSDTVSVASYQLNGSCRSPLSSGSSVGASCSMGQDCAEVCCSCSSGLKDYSAQACVNSKCADSATACAKATAQSPSLCQ